MEIKKGGDIGQKKQKIENRVRLFRKLRGMTQQDLASRLGVSRQTVNAIENGRYEASLPLAFDIAHVFASRIEDIFRPVCRGVDVMEWTSIVIKIPDALDADPVVLRPHKASDLQALERFITDADSTRYMAFTDAQKTPEGAATMMDAVMASYATDTPILSLTVADRETDLYLGALGGADAGSGAMEVFITLMPEARGRGIATAAMGTLCRFLFESCGAKELRADTVEENTRSISLFQRLGFQRVGAVERAAEGGVFANRGMQGVRFLLTASRFKQMKS
ncbi:putative transcriptional regulator [Leptolyngbya sp. PCC 7375]|nr:putative transcriptional regulator [Leptolyngbya sp. PCC 7375]